MTRHDTETHGRLDESVVWRPKKGQRPLLFVNSRKEGFLARLESLVSRVPGRCLVLDTAEFPQTAWHCGETCSKAVVVVVVVDDDDDGIGVNLSSHEHALISLHAGHGVSHIFCQGLFPYTRMTRYEDELLLSTGRC